MWEEEVSEARELCSVSWLLLGRLKSYFLFTRKFILSWLASRIGEELLCGWAWSDFSSFFFVFSRRYRLSLIFLFRRLMLVFMSSLYCNYIFLSFFFKQFHIYIFQVVFFAWESTVYVLVYFFSLIDVCLGLLFSILHCLEKGSFVGC